MKELTKKDIENICDMYKDYSIEKISSLYKIGDRRVRKILTDNGISIRNSHEKTISTDNYIEANIERFPEIEGRRYIAVLKNDQNIKFEDYLNKSGILTSYIKNTLNIEIPSLFLRKKYFHEHNCQWHEQWFTVISVPNELKEVKKCPYCNWETIDVNNRSGMFLTHLLKEHGISREAHLKEHPEDKDFFSFANPSLNRKMETDENKFVKCAICGEKFARIDWRHLSKHNITEAEYKNLYCNKTVSSEFSEKMSKIAIIINENTKPVYTSKPQLEIYNFIKSNGVECELNNRKILHGTELDIYVPSLKIAIEYNGNFWHTEGKNNKSPYCHLNKLEKCKKEGIKLIQIFEDEYFLKKEIVTKKLLHLLNAQQNLPKIAGRKCNICEICKHEAETFLNKNHIQGHVDSTIYLGAYFNNNLVGVMNFKREYKENNRWELTRFATDNNYICSGIGGKLFKHFIKHFNPEEVKSFADRRWTINENDNLYINLGFSIEKYLKPDYKYYNSKIDRYKRFHKFGFRKEKLHKKYGLPLTMTETEMAKALGYDRIWDCGLIKYVWKKEDKPLFFIYL